MKDIYNNPIGKLLKLWEKNEVDVAPEIILRGCRVTLLADTELVCILYKIQSIEAREGI